MNLEHSSLLIVVLGGIALLSAAANVVQIIVAFRRTPPAEAQFADAEDNDKEHAQLHKRITDLTNPEKTPFVFKAVNDAEEKHRKDFRDEISTDVKRLTKITTALAVKMGIEVTEEL
jgi:hypothetical protein